ncbi:MAG: hypothetical protein M1840_005088 [Geoglossum simile]|nr:MAG: hypothetical protein M1840_005088 [Geoglossum simile]
MNQCHTCRERSNWFFLKEFYHRVETADNYSRKLEVDLHHSRIAAHTAAAAHADCQSALTKCQNALEEERLEHRACKEALQFESDRRGETDRCLECAYVVAQQAGEIADSLRSEVAKLKGNQLVDDTYDPKPAPSTVNLLLDLSVARRKADVFQGIANADNPAAFSDTQMLKILDENGDLQQRILDAEYEAARAKQDLNEIETQLGNTRAEIAYLQQTAETSSPVGLGSGTDEGRRGGKQRMVKKE